MILIITLVLVMILLYLYGTRNFNYWKNRNVVFDQPYPFVGNSARQLLCRVSFNDFFNEFYKKYPNERFVGLYSANKPVLVVREPRDVQTVLVSDFHSFYPRGLKAHKDDRDPFLRHLFLVDGDMWKLLRQRLTPAFTSGKLKAMFSLIVQRAEKLEKVAAEFASNNVEVNVKELMVRYTIDFIGACGFGIDMDALGDEHSIFRKLGNRVFTVTKYDMFKNFMKAMMPPLMKGVRSVPYEVASMTTSLVNKVMEDRNFKPSSRHDFIDLLMELKNKGKMVGESLEKKNPDGSPLIVECELDDELIAAQAYIFFVAGFQTSSTSSSHTLHMLALHQETLKKCHEEIDEILQKYDNKLCYDAIIEMKYLKMCFYESMRIFPSVGVLFRKSASKYTFPDSNLTIDEGVGIVVCQQAMQMDEKYFDEPEKFRPERFSAENIKKIPSHVFLPFGEGPRACIGERLGLMQSLAGLAAILRKFSVEPSKNTQRNPIADPLSGPIQTLKGGVPVLMKIRKKEN